MDRQRARRLFADARVARLATVDDEGRPHLVPIVFALHTVDGADVLVSAVDGKPKRTHALRRLANVEAHPRVSVLVDRYDDGDWDVLWWVRLDGVARVVPPGSPSALDALDVLVARYPQYRRTPPDGPVMLVDVERWTGWSAG